MRLKPACLRAGAACVFAVVSFLVAIRVAPVQAADDLIERLATCQDSWLDWKQDDARMRTFAKAFQSAFAEKDRKWMAKSKIQVAGLPVLQAFPQNLGMGVGFSVIVDAPFDRARAAVEKIVGQPIATCDSADGMRTCELQIATKRSVTLLSGTDPKSPAQTLVGCYYYYEK
jgi:hypothetical protein